MPRRKIPRLGGSTSNPINLSGFTPLVDLTGDPRSFPFGAMVDTRYRSRRALRWWRSAIDAVRMILRQGLELIHWKRTVPRPPPVQIPPDDNFIWWNDFLHHLPGTWGSGRYSDAQDVIGFYPHPYLRPTEDSRFLFRRDMTRFIPGLTDYDEYD